MSDKITPTVGRIVWYYPSAVDGLAQFGKGTPDAQPLAATVAAVHSDNMVNLSVLDSYGNPHARPNVFLVQPGAQKPDNAYCTWMPYQVKAAGIELPVVEAPAPASDLAPAAESDAQVSTEGDGQPEESTQDENVSTDAAESTEASVAAEATETAEASAETAQANAE